MNGWRATCMSCHMMRACKIQCIRLRVHVPNASLPTTGGTLSASKSYQILRRHSRECHFESKILSSLRRVFRGLYDYEANQYADSKASPVPRQATTLRHFVSRLGLRGGVFWRFSFAEMYGKGWLDPLKSDLRARKQ
jgi:hypothetical protein